MRNRRNVLAFGALSAMVLTASRHTAFAAGDCPPVVNSEAVGSSLLDRYVAAVNAHDTAPFPELFTETYIQHSGRSASGLAAQIENFRRILTSMPDLRLRVEDRIIAGDKVVARNTYSATHTQPIRDISPTGKGFTFRTIDIWRIENGKFAEHWDLTDTAEVLAKLRAG
jgi:predicted ester cyclase